MPPFRQPVFLLKQVGPLLLTGQCHNIQVVWRTPLAAQVSFALARKPYRPHQRMTKISFAVGVILISALGMLFLSQHRSRVALREENRAVRQQLDQLTDENDRLSNALSQATNPPVGPDDDQLLELLSLRTEVLMVRSQTNVAASVPNTNPRIGELEILSARFGAGTNLVDVTARVVLLLHRESRGFAARVDWLGVDPAPYKTKSLVIVYYRAGKQNTFRAHEGRKVSYELLLATATR